MSAGICVTMLLCLYARWQWGGIWSNHCCVCSCRSVTRAVSSVMTPSLMSCMLGSWCQAGIQLGLVGCGFLNGLGPSKVTVPVELWHVLVVG